MKSIVIKAFIWATACFFCCSSSEDGDPAKEEPKEEGIFYFGADLSYVNQVLDKGGQYKVNGSVADPYNIFAEAGTNLIRLRLWHDPKWTKAVYGENGTQMYNDIADVEKSIALAKAHKMEVLLDFHYSDTWADPGHQDVPAAWAEVTDIESLEDSVYNYTVKVLSGLRSKNLLPAFVQVGNETNCGMMLSGGGEGFPQLNVCEGKWASQGKVINAGIRAVRDVTADAAVKTKVILHVADPKNVEWWFDNIRDNGGVSDFDIVGFSYYPLWHTTVSVNALSDKVRLFKSRYDKDVMMLETAYPWTTDAADSYNNHFGSEPAISGYPKTPEGQYSMMVKLAREMKDGGGIGLVYWEPAWITSDLKDLWGTGSSWENSTFFDFEGNVNKGIEYMKVEY